MQTRLGGEHDPLKIVQESEIWTYYEMVYAQTRIPPKKCDKENSLGFWDPNGSPDPRPRNLTKW